MKKQIFCILFLVLPILAFTQDKKDKVIKSGISFSGYIKNNIIYDTRQTVDLREGEFLLYPKPSELDVDSIDINEKPSFNMLAIETLLTGDISGPDAFGAKTSGVLEANFFGSAETNMNGFRLRHAYGKMKWQKSEILFGQYWHPMFVSNCYPNVASYNTGAPFQPYSRNPQLRFTYFKGDFKVLAAFLSQIDFASPEGSMTLRNSASPDMQLQLHYNKKNDVTGKEILAGAGIGYKTLEPRVVTNRNYLEKGKVKGLSAIGFVKYKNSNATLRIKGVWGQNMYDLLMLGGYAVLDNTFNNKLKADFDTFDYRNYSTLDVFSIWMDCHTNGENIQAGLFWGFTKNLGSLHNILGLGIVPDYYFVRERNIDYIYRVASRMVFTSGDISIAGEVEYTVAAYGNTLNSLGEVQDASAEFPTAEIREVTNLRLLCGFYYYF